MQSKLHNILLEIVERKKQDLALDPAEIALETFQKKMPKKNDNTFIKAITSAKTIGLIAEIKFASPTNPSLGSEKDLLQRAKAYEAAGVDAISLITEPHFFKGDVSFVSRVKTVVKIPVLQKDFIIDERQIYQAKEIGSDALLLIARLLDEKSLQRFVNLCYDLHIEPVVEINNQEDLEKAVKTETKIVAVNARDLETFAISVSAACLLLSKIPKEYVRLGFSGIYSKEEVLQYKQAGAKSVLVGTSLMKAENIKEFIGELRNYES